MMEKKRIKVADSLEELFDVKRDEDKRNEAFSIKLKDGPDIDEQEGRRTDQFNFNFEKQCPPPIKTVKITKKAITDLILMSRAVNALSIRRWGANSPKMEVFCYVLCDTSEINENTPAIITDILIPRHNASEASVEVSEKNILEIQRYIKKHKKTILGWAHSHGQFEVFSSKIDEKNHQTLLMDTNNIIEIKPFHVKYIYGITVNDKGERFGVILTQFPCGHIQRMEDTEFEIIGSSYSKEAENYRYKEIKDIVYKKVLLKEPVQKQSQADLQSELVEELMDQFIHKIRKAKHMLFEEVPSLDNKTFSAIQNTLKQYDELLIDSLEESFKEVSRKLSSIMQSTREGI